MTGEVFAQMPCKSCISRKKNISILRYIPPSSRKVEIILSLLRKNICTCKVVPVNFTTNLKYGLLLSNRSLQENRFNAINILNYLQILEHQQRCITVVGKPSKRDKNLISGESDYWC